MYELLSVKKALRANVHHLKMKRRFKNEIILSIKDTTMYPDSSIKRFDVEPRFSSMNTVLIPYSSVDAVFSKYTMYGKTAVLNYASFLDPGGSFLRGARAQEEALCHESILYEVLSNFRDGYYKENKKRVNNHLYTDDMLYSKDILFQRRGKMKHVDVITCAAPNAILFANKSDLFDRSSMREKLYYTLVKRIYSILLIAYKNHVDNIVIGAFGCGVFGNDPTEVARIFNNILEYNFNGAFKNVIYAIPNKNSKNYIAFQNVIGK